ncbi:MAG: 30S ribosomal protein S12 methylthiotransferase RimO [Eubacteriales bacterium]|nr:30S ribosomal protein S12 methylthiotransferase RimO [Eubacteriales bacterium]
MKIGLVSLGCPKNLTDSETMIGLLSEHGHELVDDVADAEIIIVNTCGFINDAKQESIDTVLEMAEYKKKNCKKLIMTGCLAERYHDDIMTELPEVDAVVGTGDYYKICEVIDDVMNGEKPCLYGNQNEAVPEGLARITATPPYTAYIKISDGCDNNCTYCAIPQIRGKYRSRKIEDILAEANELAENGVKELILIAQDTTRYGKDIYGRYSLDRLLKELCKIDKLHWIRLHYFYPEAVTEDVLDIMAKEDKICKYIDMPIQHINDDVLRRMARRTDSLDIKKKIEQIREKMPDAVIRTSLISGFPGEDEKAHKQLYDFVKEYKLDRVGVFAYSQEEGTVAAQFPEQLADEIKEARADEIMQLQREISLEKNKARLGTVLEVLCEGYDEENYMYYGRSYADSIDIDNKVYFASEDEVEIGSFVKVEILDCDEYDLTGKEVL